MHLDGPRAFELTIPSRLEELSAVQTLVEHAVREYQLNEELAYWIELSVSESAINAIRHGNGLDPSKKVFLKIASDGKVIEVIVEDQGNGFDLAEIPDPTKADNLLKPSGRGILIIKSFMDEVNLSRAPGGGSRLRMVKRLSPANL